VFRRAGRDLTGKRLLDAGCGNGLGLELIAEAFRPSRLVGFDLMPAQISRALHGGFIQFQDKLIGTSHPPAAAFDWVTFRTGLEAAGFDVVAEGEILPFGPVRSFCAVKRS
jgi:2-polyprenyl-3-methyl-5-hydroxy-6-metoxy-1,4-benzoquinol methylase